MLSLSRNIIFKNNNIVSKLILQSTTTTTTLSTLNDKSYGKFVVNYSKKITTSTTGGMIDPYEERLLGKNAKSQVVGLDDDQFDEQIDERERNRKVEKSKRIFNQKKKKKVSSLDVFLNETQNSNEPPQVDLIDGDQIHVFPPLPKSTRLLRDNGGKFPILEDEDLSTSHLTEEDDTGAYNDDFNIEEYDEFSREFQFDEDHGEFNDEFEDEGDIDEDPIGLEAMKLLKEREREVEQIKKIEREKQLKKKHLLIEAGFSDEEEIRRLTQSISNIDNELSPIGGHHTKQSSQTADRKKPTSGDRRSNYIKYQIFSKNQSDLSKLSVRLFEVDRLRGTRTNFNDDILEEKEVQVLDVDGSRLGVMSGPKAYRLAYVRKLDIFLTYSGKNMVYGRLMALEDYIIITEKRVEQEIEKKENVATKPTKSVLISSNISINDRETKFGMIKKFLSKRHSVEVTLTYKNDVVKEEGEEIFSLLEKELHGIGKLQSNYEKQGGKIFSRFYQPFTVKERDAHLKKLEREENERQLKLKERLEREEIDRLEELGEDVDPIAIAAKVAAAMKKMQIQQQLAEENIFEDYDFDAEEKEKEKKRREKEERNKLAPENGDGLTNKQIKQNKNKNKKLKNKNKQQKQDDDDEELF